MKIAVIDNYDSFVFNLVRYLNEISTVETIVFRNDKIDFKELSSCDAILLSPGPGIPSEAGQLMDVINAFHTTKPIFGVCLGHQAIAEYFGGQLKCNAAPVHGKSSLATYKNDALFNAVPNPFEVGRYHSWSVENKLPKQLEATAFVEDEIMALRHVELPIFGVQFHPESILTPNGRTIVNNWVASIKTN